MNLATKLSFLILLFSACVGQKGASNYYINKHPEKLAELCSARFPVEEKFIPGTPVVFTKTIKGDSIPCPIPAVDPVTGAAKVVYVQCPDTEEKTITIHDTLKVENTAKLYKALADLRREQMRADKAEAEVEFLNKVVAEYKKWLKKAHLQFLAYVILSLLSMFLIIKFK